MYPEIEEDFLNPPIEDLPLHYLRDWFCAACEPPVHKRIWGYLLPRILEVLASGEEPANVGLEVSLSHFPTGDKSQWAKAEWGVLDRFQRLYLSRVLTDDAPYLDVTLCMFGNARWPLVDLFAQVSVAADDVLARRLWADWCIGRPSVWITAFWDHGGNKEVFAFYTSEKMYKRMELLAMNATTEPELAEKALAVASVIFDNTDWSQSV